MDVFCVALFGWMLMTLDRSYGWWVLPRIVSSGLRIPLCFVRNGWHGILTSHLGTQKKIGTEICLLRKAGYDSGQEGGSGIRQPISHPQMGYENGSRANKTEQHGIIRKPNLFQTVIQKSCLPPCIHTCSKWICSRRGTLNAGCRSGSCGTIVYCTCREGWPPPSAMWSIDATSAVPHGVNMQQFTSGPADMCSHPRTGSMRWDRVTSVGSIESHYTTWVPKYLLKGSKRCDSKMLPCTNQIFLSIKTKRSNLAIRSRSI